MPIIKQSRVKPTYSTQRKVLNRDNGSESEKLHWETMIKKKKYVRAMPNAKTLYQLGP